MSEIKKVALKYCGGCNPRYDRAAAVREMLKQLEGPVECVQPDDPGADTVLAVMGCSTACADLESFRGRPARVITSEGEARNWSEEQRKGTTGKVDG